jgi:HlyD family secretion protein
MKKLWKRVIWGVIALAIIAMIVVSFLPKPIIVDAQKIGRGPMRVALDAEGRTRIHDLYVISAPVTGQLERVTLDEGDVVTEGTVVATIQPPPLDPQQQAELDKRIAGAQAMQQQTVAATGQAEAALQQARRERDRLQDLMGTGAIARQDFEQAETAVNVAEKSLAAARYNTQAAAAQVEALKTGRSASTTGRKVTLRAPATGRVLRVVEENRRMVMAGSPIIQIGNPSGLEVVVDVLSSDAVKVRAGDAILFDGWGGDRPLRGRVKYVEPSAFTKISALGIEEQRVNIICEFVDFSSELGDGFRVDAHIILWESANVLKVPTSALFREGDEWKVFVIRAGKAQHVTVELGHRNELEAEITGGLKEDDSVIVHPSDQVIDGVDVETSGETKVE